MAFCGADMEWWRSILNKIGAAFMQQMGRMNANFAFARNTKGGELGGAGLYITCALIDTFISLGAMAGMTGTLMVIAGFHAAAIAAVILFALGDGEGVDDSLSPPEQSE